MDPNAKTIISFALFFLYLSFSNISLARGAEVDDETPFTYERNPEKGPEGWGKINPHWKTCNTGKFHLRSISLTQDYDMELHMVHTSAGGKTAVIGVLYKLDKPNEFLTRLLDGIKTVGKEERDLGIVDPRTIRFQTKKFYRYIGSLTVPPCTEGVIWTVVKRVNTISMEQIAALRSAVDDGYETNSRPVQERNGRSVWFYDPNV
ncbi:hypothetical protein HID58_029596 [Brassica napus]|uniref:Alpha-carbonic anhydrase domain-containing protein n=1 Tax=Brassica napus TaxID=3708 RepID=A0ABQ8CDN2_BRANA|nr:hypothetical protein HID58_029596 [Brassica napus]